MPIPAFLHNRIRVLLIVGPPTFSAILAGALTHLVRVLALHAQTPGQDLRISIGIAVISSLVVGGICTRSIAVLAGAPTSFPKLLRAAPVTALVGFALGLYAAIANIPAR